MRECSVLVQFCLAHLIRDIKFLTKLPDARDRAYGERLREGVRQMFALSHDQAQYSDSEFRLKLSCARQRIPEGATTDVPPTRHSQNMAKRFRKHGAAYFQFITTPGVEPTNNLAGQAIRFVVIDRHITQGTRSSMGRRWCERIWTVLATCVQQGRSVFDFLTRAIEAYFYKTAAPSLVSNPS